MEESFENYLSEEDSSHLFTQNSRYGDALGSLGSSSLELGGWGDDHEYASAERGGYSSIAHAKSHSRTGDEAYDFDIDLKKKSDHQKKKKIKERKEKRLQKEKEKELRQKRGEALKKSREERMQELLGELNKERQASKLEEERKVQLEQQRHFEEQRAAAEQQRRDQLEKEEEESGEEEIGSLNSDSLEMSSADFLVGGYAKKNSTKQQVEAVAIKGTQVKQAISQQDEEEEMYSDDYDSEGATVQTLQKKLSMRLEKGLDPRELANDFTLGDLSNLMNAQHHEHAEEEDDEDYSLDETGDLEKTEELDREVGDSADQSFQLDENDVMKDASEIFASFEEESRDLHDTVQQDDAVKPAPLAIRLPIGTRIKAQLFDWVTFYEGKVIYRHESGLVDLLFEDGEQVDQVHPKELIVVQQQDLKPSQQQQQPEESDEGSGGVKEPDERDEGSGNVKERDDKVDEHEGEDDEEGDNEDEDEISSDKKGVANVDTKSESSAGDAESDNPHDMGKPSPSLELASRVKDETPTNEQEGSEEEHDDEPEKKLRDLFWSGMDATTPSKPTPAQEVSSPPPPPPSSVKSNKNNEASYSMTITGGKPRLIQRAAQMFDAPLSPPPPPPSVIKKSTKKNQPQAEPDEYDAGPKEKDGSFMVRGARISLSNRNSHPSSTAKTMTEVARLQLREQALEHQLEEERQNGLESEQKIRELQHTIESQQAEIFRLNGEIKELQSTNAVRANLREILQTGEDEDREGQRAIPREELARIEKEMAEQDRLLAGYQKENEKLVAQLREAEKRANDVRDSMYKANLRLGLEVNNQQAEQTRQQTSAEDLRRKLDSEQAVLVLEREIEDLKQSHASREASLRQEIASLKEELFAQANNEEQQRPSDDVQQQIANLRNELAQARYEHLSEAKALKSKLAWYVENQQLLNENENIIETLQQRIRELETGGFDSDHTSTKLPASSSSARKTKRSLPSDLKRIRALEKQVKELEEALRKRNPDCLANLILAAGPTESQEQSRRELRKQVEELQAELVSKEKAFQTRLRTLRQEHERVKLRYERLLEEAQAPHVVTQSVHDQGGSFADKEARVVALEQELERVRSFYRKKIEDLSKKSSVALRSAKRDGGPIASNSSAQRDTDKLRAAKVALEARVEELEMQLEHKNQGSLSQALKKSALLVEENRRLQDRVEELKAFISSNQQDSTTSKTSRKNNPDKSLKVDDPARPEEEREDESSSSESKDPESIEPKHHEKGEDGGEGDDDGDEKVEKQDRLVRYLEGKISALRDENASLQMETSKLKSELEQVNSRWETCLRRSEDAVEKLHMANRELEAQLLEAKKELNLPKTPSMLQHQALARRLSEMESKLLARERELELVVRNVEHRAELEMQRMQAEFDNTLAAKNQELVKFRAELDSLLDSVQMLRS